MAQDKNNGYRFFLDANTQRQYALFYNAEGMPQPPLHVFAEKEKDPKIAAGQVFFAIDDEPLVKEETGTLVTEVYRFESSREDASKFRVKRETAEYAITVIGKTDGSVELKYALTPESENTLRREYQKSNVSFENFPKSYSLSVDPNDPGIIPTQNGYNVSADAVRAIAFPPHHMKKRAYAARQGVDKMPVPQPQAPQRPTQQFNNKRKVDERNFKVSTATLEKLFKEFCRDLSEDAKQGRLDPVVGRQEEITESVKVLCRREQASLCFTGGAGVGKTAMFKGIAQFIADGKDVPDTLENARILELDLNLMTAGTKYRGQFEERLKPLIDGLTEREGVVNGRKVILAIDEIHNQLTAGAAEGSGGAGQMMKPFLTARGISILSATTAEEYRKYIEKDSALARRFEQKVLNEPNAETTKTIVKKLWPLYREHHGLKQDLSDNDFDYIINMTNRYAPSQLQPDKAKKVIDTAGASAQTRGSDRIERQDIISAVAQMSKLSVDFLNQNDAERFLKIEQELPNKVLGQPGLQRVVDGLIGSRSGLNDPNQPWAAFIFQGPTGTGKTETCKELARYLFGDENAIIKLDMGEYAEKHTVSRLIGAPPGYVGFDSSEPALTEKIRQRPYSILLLDEIEKAHPDVFNVLLPILNDGKMTDNQGKTVLFNNVIVIMTTNLGAKEAMSVLNGKDGFGFGKKFDPKEVQDALARKYEQARGDFFKPELVNRVEELGGFVTFIPLERTVIEKLVDRELAKVEKRMSDKTGAGISGLTIEVTPTVKAELAEQGYKPDMGARPLRKVVREKIANPVGKWIMGHKAEILDFLAKNGGEGKLFVSALGALPQLLRKDETPVVTAAANDDKPKPKKVGLGL